MRVAFRPRAARRPGHGCSGDDGHQETADPGDGVAERADVRRAKARGERAPLFLLVGRRSKVVGQSGRDGFRELGATAAEGLLDGAAERRSFEREHFGKTIDVVEVFHAAVGTGQRHDRMELFRDRCLRPIRTQARRRKIENCRQLHFDGCR